MPDRPLDSSVVWMSQLGVKGERRLALDECPVSFISGESVTTVEDFLAHRVLGGEKELVDWPARRVDAFAVLWSELRKLENHERAD